MTKFSDTKNGNLLSIKLMGKLQMDIKIAVIEDRSLPAFAKNISAMPIVS